jgi:hypothetical protein
MGGFVDGFPVACPKSSVVAYETVSGGDRDLSHLPAASISQAPTGARKANLNSALPTRRRLSARMNSGYRGGADGLPAAPYEHSF